MTVVLDGELLAGFEARLRGSGAAVVEHLAPGLEDRRIDELLTPLEIDLPEEARAWWRWHNGTLPGAPPARTEIIPGRDLLSLETSVAVAAPFALERAEIFNLPKLAKQLDLVSDLPAIYVDCNGPRNELAPIYSQNDYTEPPALVLPAMGELITIWTDLIDDEVFATTADGSWRRLDPHRVPPELQGRGII